MTQSQLDCAVARCTGESVHTVRHLGFGLLAPPALHPETEDLQLAVDCPHCGGRCGLPAGCDLAPVMGECDRCDVYFDFRPDAVYVIGGERRATDAA